MSGELSVLQNQRAHLLPARSPFPATDDGQTVEEDEDWAFSLIAFLNERPIDKIEGLEEVAQTLNDWMKMVSAALISCMNAGVDPQDVVKTEPGAKQECWIGPSSMSSQKALEAFGIDFQKQYERRQPRARFKQTTNQPADEIKKVTSTLRRNAKDYKGHGEPKPTAKGEIWVFNRSYTQYIPISIYVYFQTWMWPPSFYVFDCSNSGMIVDAFQQLADQHQHKYEQVIAQSRNTLSPKMTLLPGPDLKQCIKLAVCDTNQILPMIANELPADIFTACITTPVKIALRWFVLQNPYRFVPRMTIKSVDKISGQLNDRRTVLGELNWIFTAITDTIAWNSSLSRVVFQCMFRQDVLVASQFRSFLLAQRILKSYDCTPISWLKLPATEQHSMWSAWHVALDICLAQLPGILEDRKTVNYSPSFEEHLAAFQVRLSPPNVLQVRAATVFALGNSIRSGGKAERNEGEYSINDSVALRKVNPPSAEASPLVHKEVFSA